MKNFLSPLLSLALAFFLSPYSKGESVESSQPPSNADIQQSDDQATRPPVPVSFLFCYNPDRPEEPATKRILALAKDTPELLPSKWGGLVLPGAGGRATFMLALAGGSAPDIYKAWFHILRHDISQGFVYPLDEWVAPLPEETASRDLWDHVRSFNGHVWALPTPGCSYYGIIYRKDFVREAGLDPESPPATWSEFSDWCEHLTVKGRLAFAIENRPWGFLPWVQSAGGDVITQDENGKWKASFDSEEAVAAAEYLQSLVQKGVVRGLPTLSIADEVGQLFASGEIAAVFGGEDLVLRLTETLNFPPELIGIMPFPARDAKGMQVLQAHRHFYAMSESVAHRPKHERDMVWRCLQALASNELADEDIHRNVAEGRAMWCKPTDLKRLGYEEELALVPQGIREMYSKLERGEIKAVTEPWVGFWQAASDLVQRRFLGILLSDSGATMNCREALETINADANRGLMFDSDISRIEKARPLARTIFGIVIACILASWLIILKSGSRECDNRKKEDSGNIGRGKSFLRAIAPWLFLAPAILSILLWSYYPLFKGAIMAFQDYRIVGQSSWAGLDNFIRVSTDPGFWAAWGRTFEYVAITLALGFITPIILAVMLCEIPRGKVFFRFLYFLPHLTSALVVTLLWKLMFDPTENGILNKILATIGIARHSWLLDPDWAMVCCILPGVWAGAGISSLIYIAALSSLPQDYYEAAAIDGAGFLARLRHVTLPQLAPLMVINFVGAFIAAFQGMGSIFLLTFGGPGDATQVLSLQIWKEAYNNLRFSTATTMAWYLGIALIAFTYLQIRFLRRVEFRRAEAK
ncbi:MAG: extracellular solute-binding protein [Kiritimatiellae bacterium]|nr:extracellular solute-binding protein [Kiritimatiellia bacterium]